MKIQYPKYHLLKEEKQMEKLEELLKNKKKILVTTCIAIVTVIIAIVMMIEQGQNKNGQSIDLLEKMEEEIEMTNKQENTEGNMQGKIQENQIGENRMAEEVVEQKKIAVHIKGEVKKKGILYLEIGARIADAIDAAGGATKEANLDEVNLAYILEDGQKIHIPNKKEKMEKSG